MSISRRHFIARSAAFGLGFAGLQAAFAREVFGASGGARLMPGPFGPLVVDPKGVFNLPAGFSYKVISRAGETMADGLKCPARPDAMAAFPGDEGLTLLACNHEVSGGVQREGPFGAGDALIGKVDPSKLFDAGRGASVGGAMPGGTTTIVYDTRRQQVIRQFLSSGGTVRNCAGGTTPRNTWITCEETVARADQLHATDHGYCFEVPMTEQAILQKAEPIRGMGRFNHEACVTDPETGIVYQTEDRSDGLIYRFVPKNPDRLLDGGRLEALVVVDRPGLDTRNRTERTIAVGEKLRVRWIDLQELGIDIESPDDTMRLKGFAAGAARFARGEGMWWGALTGHAPAAYFACTNGGPARQGQIFKLTPDGEGGELELFVESEGSEVLNNADNIAVTPYGHLIVCEDGSAPQRLIGITPQGEAYEFARNILSESELAGACFSPDGTTLFVNIQHDGLTLAITGPWPKG
jgi:uncharacterized protein